MTTYKWNELLGNNLPAYIAPAEVVANRDLVMWYQGGLHHIYRDEDGDKVGGQWQGTALLMWTSFTLKPANLFSETPLYP